MTLFTGTSSTCFWAYWQSKSILSLSLRQILLWLPLPRAISHCFSLTSFREFGLPAFPLPGQQHPLSLLPAVDAA